MNDSNRLLIGWQKMNGKKIMTTTSKQTQLTVVTFIATSSIAATSLIVIIGKKVVIECG